MNYDLLVKVVAELNENLAGARINKIYQPDEHLVVMKLWNGVATFPLLLSAAPTACRIHLTDREFLNPALPPRFCQLLRARISKILSFEIANNDRVVRMECSGKQGDCVLYVELIGSTSNMVLCRKDDVVIDCLKRTTKDGSGRDCQAGAVYRLPEKNKEFEIDRNLCPPAGEQPFPWNRHAEALALEKSTTGSRQELKEQLKASVRKQLKKLTKRIENIESDLKRQSDFERNKHFGELLLANLHQVKKGMESVRLDDYYRDPPESVVIPLDPLVSPQENAQKYFQRFKKYKNGADHSRRRLEETQSEFDWLVQLEYQLDDEVERADVEEIAQELRGAGLVREKNRLHGRRTQRLSGPREATSPTGFKVLWGRNNSLNDQLSTRLLKKGDLWFHAFQVPGAHVVLKTEGRPEQVGDDDILFAASIAAGYSKLKNDTRVEVMIAEPDAVKKPKNARPGQVVVTKFRTISVEPTRIENQKKKN